MKALITLMVIAMAVHVTGATASELIIKKVEIGDVRRVFVTGSAELVITQGEEDSLVVTTSKSMMGRVQIKRQGSTLILGTKNLMWGFFDFDSRVRFEVTLREIEEISASGSGHVRSSDISSKRLKVESSGSGNMQFGKISAEQLELEISGSSDLKTSALTSPEIEISASGSSNMRIEAIAMEHLELSLSGSSDLALGRLLGNRVEVDISGSSDIKISGAGKVDEQQIEIRGSSDYRAMRLESKLARLELSGSSDVTVYVTEDLQVNARGASDVHYFGNPRVSAKTRGHSEVISLETGKLSLNVSP